MTKLCPRGKAAAKRKFKVYPSAYANAYASKICAGKIKDPSGTKRKDFRGPKPAGAKKGAMISRREQLIKKQNPHSEYDKKGKLKYTAANLGGMTAGSMSGMGRLQKARMMNKGGGADTGTMGERKSKLSTAIDRFKRRIKKQKLQAPMSSRTKKMLGPKATKALKQIRSKRFLKEMPGFEKGGDAKIKKVISGLNKASALHKSQAKSLQTVVGKSVGGMADYYKDLM